MKDVFAYKFLLQTMATAVHHTLLMGVGVANKWIAPLAFLVGLLGSAQAQTLRQIQPLGAPYSATAIAPLSWPTYGGANMNRLKSEWAKGEDLDPNAFYVCGERDTGESVIAAGPYSARAEAELELPSFRDCPDYIIEAASLKF